LGSSYDLGVDNYFKSFKVIVGMFYKDEVAELDNANLSDAIGELGKKGFKMEIVTKEQEFITKLPDFDIAWIISGCVATKLYAGIITPINPVDGINIANAIEMFCSSKNVENRFKGVFIWADNYPFVAHANYIVQKLFKTDVKLEGDVECSKVLNDSNTPTKGMFRNDHPITTGIKNLFEGVTISYPSDTIPELKVIATSSENKPVILCAENNSKRGRVVLDCGYTKLYTEWDSAGTGRYVSNATCWLAGIDIL